MYFCLKKKSSFWSPINDYIHITHFHITANLQLKQGFNVTFKENYLQLGIQLV